MRYIKTNNGYTEFIESDPNGRIINVRGFKSGELYFQIKHGKITFYLNDQDNPWRNDVWTVNIPITIDDVAYDNESDAADALKTIMNSDSSFNPDNYYDKSDIDVQMAEKADASAITEVNSAITDINSSITEINSAITDINSAITDVNSALTDVNSAITEINSSITEINSAITEVNSAITELSSGLTDTNSALTAHISDSSIHLTSGDVQTQIDAKLICISESEWSTISGNPQSNVVYLIY